MSAPTLSRLVTIDALNTALSDIVTSVPDGLSATPGLAFGADQSTGLMRQTNGTLAIVQSGEIVLAVDGSGLEFNVAPTVGGASRAITDAFSDLPTLRSFGASGGGSTSDAVAIAAAITSGKTVIASDGKYLSTFATALQGQSCWHPASTGFIVDGGELIPIGNIYSPITLYVGSGHAFSALIDCLDYLLARKLYAQVIVQIADGSYSVSEHHFSHPDGENVSILGNVTTPGNVVFNVDTSNRNSFILVDQSCVLGMVNGMTVNGSGWVSHGVWTANHVGCAFQSDAGASIFVGANVVINKYYYGLRANTGGYIGANAGVVITEAGDVGVHAFNGGHIECPGIAVSLCADTANSLGNGIMAELGGTISCEGAYSYSNGQNGIVGSSTGVVWALNSNTHANGAHQVVALKNGCVLMSATSNSYATGGTSTSNAAVRAESGGHVEAFNASVYSNSGDGFSANGGTIECQGASVTNNTGIGAVARNGGRIYYSSLTNTGNGGTSYADSISVVGANYG